MRASIPYFGVRGGGPAADQETAAQERGRLVGRHAPNETRNGRDALLRVRIRPSASPYRRAHMSRNTA